MKSERVASKRVLTTNKQTQRNQSESQHLTVDNKLKVKTSNGVLSSEMNSSSNISNKVSYDFLPEYAMTDFGKLNGYHNDNSSSDQNKYSHPENDNKNENYSSNANLNGKIASGAIKMYKDPWFDEDHPEIFEIDNWTNPKSLAAISKNNAQHCPKENLRNKGNDISHLSKKTGVYTRTTTKNSQGTYAKSMARNEKGNTTESLLPTKRKKMGNDSLISTDKDPNTVKSNIINVGTTGTSKRRGIKESQSQVTTTGHTATKEYNSNRMTKTKSTMNNQHKTNIKGKEKADDAEEEDFLKQLLDQHNKRFKSRHVQYQPALHSASDTRKWEAITGKKYYNLSAQERVDANDEIAQMRKDGRI